MWLGVLSPLVVSDSVILWTVAHQNPLSMGFPGKNTGVCCHLLLQGTLKGLNPPLLLGRQILYH